MKALLERKKKLQAELQEIETQINRKGVYSRDISVLDSYASLIADLSASSEDPIVGGERGVNTKEDQLKVLTNMHDCKIPLRSVSLGSLFGHADNVRYSFDEKGMDVPSWFRSKYGQHFVEGYVPQGMFASC